MIYIYIYIACDFCLRFLATQRPCHRCSPAWDRGGRCDGVESGDIVCLDAIGILSKNATVYGSFQIGCPNHPNQFSIETHGFGLPHFRYLPCN